MTKGTTCRLYPFLRSTKTASGCRNEAMKRYQAGADRLATWDESHLSSALGVRRLGHVEELKQAIVKTRPKSRVIRLLSLGGYDLTRSAVPINHERII